MKLLLLFVFSSYGDMIMLIHVQAFDKAYAYIENCTSSATTGQRKALMAKAAMKGIAIVTFEMQFSG